MRPQRDAVVQGRRVQLQRAAYVQGRRVQMQRAAGVQGRRVRLQDGTALLLAETHGISRGHVRICPSQVVVQAGRFSPSVERSRRTANAYMAPDAARGRAAVHFCAIERALTRTTT